MESEKEIFVCNFCQSSFSTKSNLKTHMVNAKKCLKMRGTQQKTEECNKELMKKLDTIIDELSKLNTAFLKA